MSKPAATRNVASAVSAASAVIDPASIPGPVEPCTISPAPKVITRDQGTINEVSFVQCRVQLPPHVYEAYSLQATAANRDPELLLAERLVRCLLHNEAGLWFSAEEKKKLEAFLGRMIGDAAGALQRLDPLKGIDVSGVHVELPVTTLKRLSTRTRRGQSLEDLIKEQVVKALRQYVGELPY